MSAGSPVGDDGGDCEACQEIFDVARYGAPDDMGMDDERDPEHTFLTYRCDANGDWSVTFDDEAPVPAVTDDEAATEVIARALHSGLHERQPIPQPVIDEANAVISGLRAAGYSLVRSTREDT